MAEKLSRLLAALVEQEGGLEALGARWDEENPWSRLERLRDAGFEFARACRVAQLRWDDIAERIRRRIAVVSESSPSSGGLKEQKETLTAKLIDAVFLIDQAIGDLEIIRDAISKDPEAAAPGVRDEITDQVVQLEDVVRRLERLRGKLT